MVNLSNRARPVFLCARFIRIMWEELGRALCLVFIIEGIIPFLYPGRWRKLVVSLATVSDRQLRIMGLVSMLLGVLVLYLLSN